MFGMFKKKQPEAILDGLLKLDDFQFVQTVKKLIKAEDRATGAMCIVARANLISILGAFSAAKKSDPSVNLPTNLDEFLVFLASNLEKQKDEKRRLIDETNDIDEINERRVAWFFLAGLIMRATAKAKENPELQDEVAEMWAYLIQCSAHIKALLEHNMVWSNDEKLFFADIKDERSGMDYTLELAVPTWLYEHKTIKPFRQEFIRRFIMKIR